MRLRVTQSYEYGYALDRLKCIDDKLDCMSGEISFHRIEEIQEGPRHSIICSVSTKRFGYLQVEYKNLNRGNWKLSTLPAEPNLNMLTSKQVQKIELICAIVYRLTFDVPAAKERLP